MDKQQFSFVAGSVLALTLAGCGRPDPVTPAPAGTEAGVIDTLPSVAPETAVLLENEHVRVSRVRLAPGSKLAAQEGGRRAVYSLSDYEIEFQPDGAVPERRTWASGDVHFHDAGKYALANIGTTPAEFVVFERLAAPLPAGAASQGKDAADVMPEQAKLLAENPSFRVMQVSLEPGDAQPVHDGRVRVVYSLSDYEIEWREGDAAPEKRQWRTGQAHWHLSGKHAARNTGRTEARWLIVALKD